MKIPIVTTEPITLRNTAEAASACATRSASLPRSSPCLRSPPVTTSTQSLSRTDEKTRAATTPVYHVVLTTRGADSLNGPALRGRTNRNDVPCNVIGEMRLKFLSQWSEQTRAWAGISK